MHVFKVKIPDYDTNQAHNLAVEIGDHLGVDLCNHDKENPNPVHGYMNTDSEGNVEVYLYEPKEVEIINNLPHTITDATEEEERAVSIKHPEIELEHHDTDLDELHDKLCEKLCDEKGGVLDKCCKDGFACEPHHLCCLADMLVKEGDTHVLKPVDMPADEETAQRSESTDEETAKKSE